MYIFSAGHCITFTEGPDLSSKLRRRVHQDKAPDDGGADPERKEEV